MRYDELEIIKSKRKTLSIEIKRDERIIVHVPIKTKDSEIEKFISSHALWIERHLAKIKEQNAKAESAVKLTDEEIGKLKKDAKEIFRERAEHFAPIVGVTYGRICVKVQKTLWGSCSAKGNLNFNCLLLLVPSEVLDSVVVHELCHRKYMNHSKEFYGAVLAAYPEYYSCNAWLKKNGRAILDRYF